MAEKSMIGLDTVFLQQVIAEGGSDSRKLLAVQVAALLRDPTSPMLEREQVVPIILKLAVDPDLDVRQTLSTELLDVPKLHPDVLFALAADDDAIALGFLQSAVGLDAPRMLAILKVGDVARQSAIAKRPDLTRDIIMHLLAKGAAQAILVLMENRLVELKDADFHKLYDRFALEPEVMDVLLARNDLPPDIRITQMRKVAGRMKQYVAEFSWSEDRNSLDMVDEAEDQSVISVLEMSGTKEAPQLASFLARKNLLTPALMMRAASCGQMKAVELMLMHLSGSSRERIQEMMYGRRGSGLRSALARSGLPANCHGLLFAACEVAADAREQGIALKPERFGRRLLEVLMTKNDPQSVSERHYLVDMVTRYADPAVRAIARKLKANLARAAA